MVATSTTDGDPNLPTFALYPANDGGYVLIVQQPTTGSPTDVSTASLVAGAPATLTLSRTSESGQFEAHIKLSSECHISQPLFS